MEPNYFIKIDNDHFINTTQSKSWNTFILSFCVNHSTHVVISFIQALGGIRTKIGG